MKRRRMWTFASADGSESWWGDCPKWVAALRRTRPDLTETVSIRVGPRTRCLSCENGWAH